MATVGGVTFLMALAAIGARATEGARVTADEPQYLLSALSIVEDLDLDISDEIAEQRYLPFHEVELDPQTVTLNPSGQRLSPHDPLFPLILSVPMRLGGWIGAKTTLALIAAATACVTLWLTVSRFGAAPGPAAVVVGAGFAAPPLTSYGTQIYPEMPAALLVTTAVVVLTGNRSPRSDVVVMSVVIALPWLAVKYVPIAVVLAAALLLPGVFRGRRRSIVASTCLVVAGVIYLVVHRRIYGGWTVYAAGDHFIDGEFGVVGTEADYAGRSRRLIGLMVDRGFGLVPWSAAYLLALPALVALVRRRADGWLPLVSIVVVGWAVATWVALTMHGWWWPGRQVVVVLPLVVAAIAALVDGRPWLRWFAVGGSLLGTFAWLWLVVEASTGRRTLIVDFATTTNPWYRLWSMLFPDLMSPTVIDHLFALVWGVALGLLGLWAWRSSPVSPAQESVAADE